MAESVSDLTKEQLLEMYYEMVLIRRFEDRCKELFSQRKIGGVYLHLYNGQEATGVGAVRALRPTDHVITAYRDHGIALAKGVDPNRAMAEMFGKRTGVSGGKGGSMHLADRSKNFWGGYAIVAAHLPLAAGIALKLKYNDEKGVVLCFMGDGATNNGYFHEALNLSAVWDLPVIWLIENNLYGMGTAVNLASGQPELTKRAIAYGMKEGPRVDGMNVIEVYNAVREAAEYARQHGPILMESMTYRYEGHGVSDRMYATRVEEMKKYKELDPIIILRNILTEQDRSVAAELDEREKKATAVIDEAVAFAEQSPDPTYEDLVNHIYV
ncbi:MAG: pyruvate dehydrogenase (acetyl-transferring) E1 component subunit alpha [Anaerolineae bacterium]|nr:pyruvate dehydrogenase (acetyl-transferring) E1 component subunit alpha [Anaerolineae bacterium]